MKKEGPGSDILGTGPLRYMEAGTRPARHLNNAPLNPINTGGVPSGFRPPPMPYAPSARPEASSGSSPNATSPAASRPRPAASSE